jgi:DNA-binding GntR family transcriptional regulator
MKITPKQLELAKLAAQWLSQSIHKPGDRITEKQLTDALRVSRSPVRAIMPYLAKKGFLTEGEAGYFVSDAHTDIEPQGVIPKSADQKLFDRIIADRGNDKIPGDFAEAELIRRYKVPRSQLTRVLIRLSLDGIVEPNPGQGWRFRPNFESDKAYLDSYRFRMIIEPAGILEETYQQDDEKLRVLLERHMNLKVVSGIEPRQFIEANAAFHETVARFSNNVFIVQDVLKHTRLRRFTEHLYYEDDRMHSLVDEHIHVIEALLSGQREWASALMKRHLQIALAYTKRRLQEHAWPSDQATPSEHVAK